MCGSPRPVRTRSEGSRPLGWSSSSPSPEPGAVRRASRPVPTEPCGSRRPAPPRSGGSPRPECSQTSSPFPRWSPRPLGAIAQGPDGALWFVDEGLDHVRRITTSGGHTQFPGPAGSGLSGIASGPDGALWLTGARSGKIVRMTTGGGLSEYTLPTQGAGPTGITAGPDGALWFTERLSGAIGRISTDTLPDALPTGPPGPQGPQGSPGPAGQSTLVVVAFQVRPARPRAGRRLRVRYAITGPADVELQVKRGRGRARTVARRSVRRAGAATI